MIELSQLKTQKPFGQELLEKGVISQEELATALSLQNQSADRIGKLFMDIGAISEADLVAHLSSGEPNKTKVAKVTRAQVEEIAKLKMPDLNCTDLEMACNTVAGTARSMGVEVAD